MLALPVEIPKLLDTRTNIVTEKKQHNIIRWIMLLLFISGDAVFTSRPFRRCHSVNAMKTLPQSDVSTLKKARFSESESLPEELITLSFDLLNHIHHHDQQYQRKGKAKTVILQWVYFNLFIFFFTSISCDRAINFILFYETNTMFWVVMKIKL